VVTKNKIFKMIETTILNHSLHEKVQFLCKISKVSRSGYYHFLKTKELRKQKELKDLSAKKLILKVFNKRGYKKGARSIKMNLEKDHKTIFSLKKIGRIMRKYNIVCPHRKPNKFKQLIQAITEHKTCKNTLNRKFKQNIPRKVLLTDIS